MLPMMLFILLQAVAAPESVSDKLMIAIAGALAAGVIAYVLKLMTDSSSARKDEINRLWEVVEERKRETEDVERNMYARIAERKHESEIVDGQLRSQIDDIHKTIHEIQLALYRVEVGQKAAEEHAKFWVDAIKLNIAPSVPRDNPLTTETKKTVVEWTTGVMIPPDRLIAAAEELKLDASHDPKLTEAEVMQFSMTAAAMFSDALLARSAQLREAAG